MTRSYLGQGQGHRGLKAAKMADLKSLLLYLFEVSVHNAMHGSDYAVTWCLPDCLARSGIV